MVHRSLQDLVSSGARVSQRNLFAALRAAGYEVSPTSKATHFVVRGGDYPVIIAVKRGEVLPVYVSRVARALGLRGGSRNHD